MAILMIALLLAVFGYGQAEKTVMKPHRMEMLFLLTITGDEPKNGIACRTGAQIAFDEVNARRDILPDYHMVPLFKDEKFLSSAATPLSVQFRRRLDEAGNTTVYQSPVVYGPYFSIGCAALARAAPFLDLVHISLGCISPSFTANRRLFPNLYRIKITGEMVAYPQMHFMRTAGKWNRFGLLTFSTNFLDYQMAIYLNRAALKEGFDVSFFDIVPDVDDATILRLKSSDSRVVVLSTATTILALKFLCFMHKFEMTGSRYSYILHTAAWAEPPSIPPVLPGLPYCTREVILEQYKYTFWSGFAMTASGRRPDDVQSSLGSSMADFEAKFEQMTRGQPVADNDKRMNCYDSAVHSFLALHQAEQKLIATRNISLKDYAKFPREVMLEVNASMASIDFNGFRVGRFRYSQRGEFDSDTQIVMQWTPEHALQVLYNVWPLNESNLNSYSNYKTWQVNTPKWYTKAGEPPRDKASTSITLTTIPDVFFWISLALASGLALFQIFSLVKVIYDHVNINRTRPEQTSFPAGLLFVTCGCLLLDAATVIFAVRIDGKTAEKPTFCLLQRIFTCLGLGLVHGYIVLRLGVFLHYKFQREKGIVCDITLNVPQGVGGNSASQVVASTACNKTQQSVISRASVQSRMSTTSSLGGRSLLFTLNSTVRRRSSGISVLKKPVHLRNADTKKQEKPVIYGISIIILLTSVYLVVWLASDAPKFVLITSQPVYDSVKDTIFVDLTFSCKSSTGSDTFWLAALAACHALLLASGAFLAFELRRTRGMRVPFPDFKVLRSLVGLNGSLFFGGFLLLIVLQSPSSQMMALSIASFLISASSTVAVYLPLLKAIFN